jgi:hypothetical protein
MSLAYLYNIARRPVFNIGDYVAILEDKFMNSTSGVLGKMSDRRVGEVTAIFLDQCVQVRYGSETNKFMYDSKCLGYVSVTLKPTATTVGVLGQPSEEKLGSIKSWSNFGTGDTVIVKVKETSADSTSYNVSDLIFHITTTKPLYGSKKDSRMMGGSKRKTVRRSRTKNFFTRFMSRV